MGEVTEKNIIIHTSGSESLSVIGSCLDGANKEYWIAAISSDNRKEVNVYKFNKDGINTTPVFQLYRLMQIFKGWVHILK